MPARAIASCSWEHGDLGWRPCAGFHWLGRAALQECPVGTAPGWVGGRAGRQGCVCPGQHPDGSSGSPSPRQPRRKSGSLGPCSSWVASDWVTLNGLGQTGCSGQEWRGGRAIPRTVARHGWGLVCLLVGCASHDGRLLSPYYLPGCRCMISFHPHNSLQRTFCRCRVRGRGV